MVSFIFIKIHLVIEVNLSLLNREHGLISFPPILQVVNKADHTHSVVEEPNNEIGDLTRTEITQSPVSHVPVEKLPLRTGTEGLPMPGPFTLEDDVFVDSEEPSTSAVVPAHPGSPVAGVSDYRLLCGIATHVRTKISLLPEDEVGLPPLLTTSGEEGSGRIVAA